MQSALQAIDFSDTWGEILRLVRNPYENITAALLLLGVVVIFVLIIASTVIVIVQSRTVRQRRARERERLSELAELQYLLAVLDQSEAPEQEAVAVAPPTPPPPVEDARDRRRRWLLGSAWVLGALMLTALAIGASTSSDAVCAACHVSTPHAVGAKTQTDPHGDTSCVRCHEGSGVIGSLTIEVPQRMQHFLNGAKEKPQADHYGIVASSACNKCHSVESGTTEDEARGVRVSHKEPLEAGAGCLDCHTAANGIVSTITSGMTPCLRCHDGKIASAECGLCHKKDVSYAAASHVRQEELAGRKIISTPDCGLCHEEKQECDPCHGGVRMPHTQEFKAYGHARKGVEDIWYNSGQACQRCHTPERRPCTQCHGMAFPAHPPKEWPTLHVADDKTSCEGCHASLAYVPGRDFCALCHQKPYVTQ